jgi:hypothetical protein
MKAEDREIEITATILSGLKPGQGLFQSDLQTLHLDLGDMHNLTSNIREDMSFQR